MRTYRGTYQLLPGTARAAARAQFPRSRLPVGPGDGWLYSYTVQDPPPGYVGPLPYVVSVSRKRQPDYLARQHARGCV